MTGDAGRCRDELRVLQHRSQQLSHTEVQSVDLQRVGNGSFVSGDEILAPNGN